MIRTNPDRIHCVGTRNFKILVIGDTRERLTELRMEARLMQLEAENRELVNAQQELISARERYFDLYDLAPVGYFTVSEEGIILGSNLTASRMLGMGIGAFANQPLASFILPEDRDVYNLYLRRIFEAGSGQPGKPRACELRMTGPDGSPVWVRMDSMTAGAAGHPSSSRVVITDITDRKLAEKALRRSEERFRVLADDLPAMVCEFLPDSTITFANKACCEHFGMSREELKGRPFLEFLPEESRDTVKAFYMSLTPGSPVRVYSHEVISSDGPRWQEWRDRAIFDDKGCAVKFQGIGIDITERKLAESRLMEINRELEEATARANEMAARAEFASSAKSEFLAGMSHEIRTPLNAVAGFVDLILRTDLDRRQLDYMKKMESALGSLLKTVNNSLDFSKIEAGMLKIVPAPFILTETLENVSCVFSAQAESKGIGLDIQLGADVPGVLVGDAFRLEQVLVNLVGNAVKFTDRGGVTVRVDLDEDHGDHVVIRFTVTDSGIGIDHGLGDLLFEPFVQAMGKMTRVYEGTGLGLSISRFLVGMMGGEIGFRSEPGRGSTFYFTIDLERPREGLLSEVPPPSSDLDFSALSGSRVLLVEDNAFNQQVVMEMLESIGVDVELVGDGIGAVEKYVASVDFPFDLILMDVKMPVMDGLEATRRIRKLEKQRGDNFPRVPIIALTAHAVEGNRADCMAAGMDDYITKPIDRRNLFSTLANQVQPRPAAGVSETPGGYSNSSEGGNKRSEPGPGVDRELPDFLENIAVGDALERLGGNGDLYLKLGERFIRDYAGIPGRIREALKSDDRSESLRLAHTLKSASGALGAVHLQNRASMLEACLIGEAGKDAYLADLERDLSSVIEALKKLLPSP